MSESSGASETFWVDPRSRGVVPLDGLHISRSLRKTARRGGFTVRINSDFAGTVAACADRDETWINDEITDLYRTLHRMGYAHSVEIWANDSLVGGLYGVALGGAFFGESMFSRQRDASKLAMVWLVARLRAGGYALLDTQFLTEHLASLGAIEISREDYRARLDAALALDADFFRLALDTPVDNILKLAAPGVTPGS